jgi:hypothetical protein
VLVLNKDWDKEMVRYQRQKDGAEFRDKERKRMRSPKVTNAMARPRVQNKESFQGNNLFGQWMTKRDQPYSRYVVYSYGGYHWPLFVYENGVWYENADKFSVTTSKHRSQTHPHEDTLPMSVENMRVLVDYGIAGVAVGMAV